MHNDIINKEDGLDRVRMFENELSKHDQVDCPVRHIFTEGLYSRECSIPKGTIVVSKLHKTEHVFVISKGVASVYIPGEGWTKLSAPYIGVTLPGTKRVVYAHEDTVWTTFHVTDSKDPDEIESMIIDKEDPIIDIDDNMIESLRLHEINETV